MSRRLLRVAALGLLAAIAGLSTGCVKVKPWERDLLARRDMAWDDDKHLAAIRAHIAFSKEASLPGGGAGGGGCGCN